VSSKTKLIARHDRSRRAPQPSPRATQHASAPIDALFALGILAQNRQVHPSSGHDAGERAAAIESEARLEVEFASERSGAANVGASRTSLNSPACASTLATC